MIHQLVLGCIELFEDKGWRGTVTRILVATTVFGTCIALTTLVFWDRQSTLRLWLFALVGGMVHTGVQRWVAAILRRASDGRGLLARLPLYGELLVATAISFATFLAVVYLVD